MERPGWAIVRLDHWAESLYAGREKSDARVDAVTALKAVFDDCSLARQEARRLTELQPGREQEYILLETRLCESIAPGGGFAALGLVRFTPGRRVQPDDVRVDGVWADEEAASRAVAALERELGGQWRVSVARLRSAPTHGGRFAEVASLRARPHAAFHTRPYP